MRTRKKLNREKAAWIVMRRRCLEPRFKDFPRYGGAGIKVCPQWVNNFARFLADMGPAPSPTHWLGRLDVKAGYAPDNCIWTIQSAQLRRRTCSVFVTVAGHRMVAADAARLPGMPHGVTVARRASRGISLDGPKLVKVYQRSVWISHNGTKLPLPDWARLVGIPRVRLWRRIKAGWPVERALQPGRGPSIKPATIESTSR